MALGQSGFRSAQGLPERSLKHQEAESRARTTIRGSTSPDGQPARMALRAVAISACVGRMSGAQILGGTLGLE